MAAAMNSLNLLRGPLTVRGLGFIRVSNLVPKAGSLPLFHLPINSGRTMSSVSAINDEEASAKAAAATADTGAPTMYGPSIPSLVLFVTSYI